MMKKLLIILLLGLISTVSAKSLNVTQVDKDINAYLFNGQWQKSDSLITVQLKKEPRSVKYNFMKAYNYYYARYFSNDAFDRNRTLELVKHYTWKAIQEGEMKEVDTEHKFYLGCSYAYLSRANAMQQEYWLAYWNGSEAENYLEEVLEEDPTIIDAYLNRGVNEYYPAVAITGFTSFLAWIGGMSGDRELGLQYFHAVADKGKLFQIEAKFILGLVYNFVENNREEANTYWTELHNSFPNNTFAKTQKLRNDLQTLVAEKGADYLAAGIDSLQTQYRITNANVLNGLGYALMGNNDYDNALIIFQLNVKLYPHVANCYDSLAECYVNRGDNENGIKFYRKAYEMLPSDTTITEQFRRTLKDGIEQRLADLGADINA